LIQHRDESGVVLLDALISRFSRCNRDDFCFINLKNALLRKFSNYLCSFDDYQVISGFFKVYKIVLALKKPLYSKLKWPTIFASLSW